MPWTAARQQSGSSGLVRDRIIATDNGRSALAPHLLPAMLPKTDWNLGCCPTGSMTIICCQRPIDSIENFWRK